MKAISRTRLWTVWAEGYRASGDASGAVLLGETEAPTFDEAIVDISDRLEPKPYKRDGVWYFWGCRLFDNEEDARRSFG